MDGQKSNQTFTMDFYAQLTSIEAQKKSFKNLMADFWKKANFTFRMTKSNL